MLIFIFGLIIGSFLGLVIDRLPRGESIATGRSKCNTCQRNLTPLELIPVLSFLMQRGKCRKCQSKLSLFYPGIELLTGLTFYMTYQVFETSLDMVIAIVFTSILIIISFIDIQTKIIYDRFQIAIFILAIISAITEGKNPINLIIGSLIISIPLLIIALITQGMGGGDIKLMFVSGAYLGFPNILVAFIIASISGGIYGIYSLITQKHNRKSEVPFGPFLALGLFIALLYGNRLIEWYLSFV